MVCLLIGVWLHRELSFDNFHPNGNQIFRLTNIFKSESESFSQAPSGPALGAQLPKQLPEVKATCRVFGEAFKMNTGDKQFIESNGLIADSNFFSFFGFQLKRGNKELVLQSANQVVLTENLAVKYFGSINNAIGKTMQLRDKYLFTVSGVAENVPVNSHIQFDLVVPVSWLKKINLDDNNFDIDNFWVGGWPYTYVQLANPAGFKNAEEQINEVVAKFSEKEWKENTMSYRYFLQPLRDIHLKSHLRYDAANNGSITRVIIFSIVGIIVLLLACINYINLTTAAAIKRAKETSVRKVIGATRPQLVGQFFGETFLICVLAVITGVILFKLILPVFSAWIGTPYTVAFSAVNILVIPGIATLISVIAGIYPATLLSSFNPSVALKGNFLQSRKGNIIRKGLVVFQFTISIALIVSIIVIGLQMDFVKNKSLGFDGNAIVEVKFYGNPAVRQKYPSLRDQLLSSPYILNISKHSQNVVGGLGNGWTTTEDLNGKEISTSLYQLSVDTSYFNTYNMKLAAGRFFSADFPTDTAKAVLVNEAAVRTFGWQTPENAIGKKFGKGNDARYVIGVVKDFNFESLHKPVEALLIGYATGGNTISMKIDARHIDEVTNHLTKVWKTSITEFPLLYSFVDEKIEKQYGNEQKTQGVFWAFSLLSLLIACLGLFGLSLFVVESKVKEIGIRKVLGARTLSIANLLSRDFIKLVMIAFIIASPVAWWVMHKWLQSFAYRVEISWWIFLLAGFSAILIALITISFQSVKAAMANPVKSLRME